MRWEEVPEAEGKVEQASNPILYSYEDFGRVDHRLKLHCDVVLFHEQQEELLGLVKVRKGRRGGSGRRKGREIRGGRLCKCKEFTV